MIEIREEEIVWSFDDDWYVCVYDDWAFVRGQFNSCAGGSRAMDILALPPGQKTLWMIEAKCYRRHRRENQEPLELVIARKARDTLAGLVAAAANANDDHEQRFARMALAATKIRCVVHLEPPKHPSRLFPNVPDPADLAQKIRKLIKPIDPHPRVVSTTSKWPHWTATWAPRP